ncbi:MAG TPA: class I SAM-dependent methyltransferase [Anaerolineales bacterium]
MPRYIRALSFQWLTPVYDPLIRWTFREQFLKHRLIERAGIQPGQRVLDLGCGTGTLTLMIKQAAPEALVTGLDGDEEVLEIAATKARQAGMQINWDHALAYDLPYPGKSFDIVVSSLVTHHLASREKQLAFKEIHRVLRRGGAFHILDFGRPFSPITRLQAALMQNLEEARDNFKGQIVPMLAEAGFSTASEEEKYTTLFGPVWFYQTQKL